MIFENGTKLLLKKEDVLELLEAGLKETLFRIGLPSIHAIDLNFNLQSDFVAELTLMAPDKSKLEESP